MHWNKADGAVFGKQPRSPLWDAVCSAALVPLTGMCCSQCVKSEAVGHGSSLTSAILWSGQALRFARHEVYLGRFWEGAKWLLPCRYSCAVIISSCINEEETQVEIFCVLVNITKLNFSGQTEDQRVKETVWNVDQAIMRQNSRSVLRYHIIEIPLMTRWGKKKSVPPHPFL